MQKIRNLLAACMAVLTVSALTAAPAAAQATGPDFTALTSGVVVDTTIAAILSVGAIMVGVALAVLGVRRVLRMVK